MAGTTLRGTLVLLLGLAALAGAEVRITVASDRLTYAPGAKGTLTVTLTNSDDAAVAGTLAVRLVEGIDGATPVANEPLTLAPRVPAVRSYPFDAGAAQWGHGIEARFTGDKIYALGTHAYSVIVNPFQTAIHGVGLAMAGTDTWDDAQTRAECERLAAQNIANYCNLYEAFAWAPCDYSKMTLENDEPFFSGQTQYCRKRSTIQTLHQIYHKYGINAITYGKSCAAGQPGVEYGFKHPEQMNVFSKAGFCHEDISVDVLDRMAEGRYRKFGYAEDFWQRWISSWTQMGNVDAADYGVDEIARSAKQLGWDGVRYDGHFSCWNNPEMSARLVKHAADRLQAQIPNFGIGYNYFGTQHDDPEFAMTDMELAAAAHGGGLMMSEVYRNYVGNVLPNIRHLQSVGDAIRMNGGYFLTIFDGGGPFNVALCYAGGARIMAGGGGMTLFNKFATRFSQYILDPALQRLQQPERIIEPADDPGFLWDSFIYEKRVSDTHSQLILQLVNVTRNLDFRITPSPPRKPPLGENPPREDVAFHLQLPAGYTAERAFVTDDYADFTPQDAVFTGSTLIVPRVGLWTMVVIDLKTTTPPRTLADVCAQPLKKGKPITPAVLADIVKGQLVSAGPTLAMLTAPADFTQHADDVDRQDFAGTDAPLTLWRNGRIDIHYARGIFDRLNRPWEAIMRLKNCRVTTSSLDNGRLGCGAQLSPKNAACLTGFPARFDLSLQDVLVIDNVPAAGFTQAQRHDILDFVKGGGSLLVLGDWHGLSKGCWEGSFLEEALPVRVKQSNYLLRLQGANQKIVPTPAYAQVLKKTPPDFGPGPSIDWTSQIQPRDGAQVLLKAGERPFLVVGRCGAGRVAVFAGSHSGAPAQPYWQSEAWQAVFADVLAYLAEPAAAVTKPGPELADIHTRLDLAANSRKFPPPAETTQLLRSLLAAGREDEALYTATLLLEHPEAVSSADCCLLALQLVPSITTANPKWRALGEKYQYDPGLEDKEMPETTPDNLLGKEGVKGSDLLAAVIAAKTLPDLTADTFLQWNGLDTQVRLWCIGLIADKNAVPYLRKVNAALLAQERAWAALPSGQRTNQFTTRLIRPFVAYALLRCGARNDDTLYDFCRGAMELPYYAWRQHWILEGTYDGSGIDPAIARARLASAQRAVWQLDYAQQLLPQLFQPEVVGTDDAGKRAALRALKEADCLKSVPLALDFLNHLDAKDLPAFRDLAGAKIEPLRQYMKGKG